MIGDYGGFLLQLGEFLATMVDRVLILLKCERKEKRESVDGKSRALSSFDTILVSVMQIKSKVKKKNSIMFD